MVVIGGSCVCTVTALHAGEESEGWLWPVGTPHDSTTLIYITGTGGVLKLTNPYGNAGDFVLEGAQGDQTEPS